MRIILLGIIISLFTGCSLYSDVQNITKGVSSMDRLEFAQSLASKGAFAPAIEILNKLSRANPQDETVGQSLAEVYFLAADFKNSNAAYQKLLSNGGRSCEVLNGAGKVALKLKQPAPASLYFGECLTDNRADTAALRGAAVSADLNHDYEKARNFYLRLIKIKPGNLEYRNNYAVSLMLSGHPKTAVTEISSWVYHPKSRPEYRLNLALAYALIGEWDKSKKMTLIDLPPHQAAQNLGYYKFLYQSKDSDALRSALLGPS